MGFKGTGSGGEPSSPLFLLVCRSNPEGLNISF